MSRWTTPALLSKALWLLLPCGVVAAGWHYTRERPGADVGPPYRTANVEKKDLVVSISASVTIEPEEIADVGAQVAGKITAFGAEPGTEKATDYGSPVEPGTILARIDDDLYRGEVEFAKADLAQAQSQLAQSQTGVQQATADAQKNKLRPWSTERFCIAEKDRARFVYQAKYDAKRPLICMDESSRQILCDLTPPLPMKPGAAKRIDDKYERHEVCSLFMFYDSIRVWRRVGCRESRTRTDWALELKQLLDVDYPDADLVTLVCDNLNTHDLASLYFAFNAQTARRLARRVRMIHTPKNGSWLHIAEIELSLHSRQCLSTWRFATAAAMDAEVLAWLTDRNARPCGTNWRFTTGDARIKLKSLYPIPDTER